MGQDSLLSARDWPADHSSFVFCLVQIDMTSGDTPHPVQTEPPTYGSTALWGILGIETVKDLGVLAKEILHSMEEGVCLRPMTLLSGLGMGGQRRLCGRELGSLVSVTSEGFIPLYFQVAYLGAC